MESGAYLVVLLIGAIVVVIDGQLILRNGPTYLAEVYGTRPARKLAQLATVFFHLVMLGLVALVASIGMDPEAGTQAAVIRIGVILLLTAAGHVLTLNVLSRLRQDKEATDFAEAQMVRPDQAGPGPGVPPGTSGGR